MTLAGHAKVREPVIARVFGSRLLREADCVAFVAFRWPMKTSARRGDRTGGVAHSLPLMCRSLIGRRIQRRAGELSLGLYLSAQRHRRRSYWDIESRRARKGWCILSLRAIPCGYSAAAGACLPPGPPPSVSLIFCPNQRRSVRPDLSAGPPEAITMQ